MLFNIGVLAGDTSLRNENGSWRIKGDPTEGALVVIAAKAGIKPEELIENAPRIGEIPFSSETKRMTTVHKTEQGKIAYSKGAAEVILGSCRYILINGSQVALDDKQREEIVAKGQAMASEALRVLGAAYKPLAHDTPVDSNIEKDMVTRYQYFTLCVIKATVTR